MSDKKAHNRLKFIAKGDVSMKTSRLLVGLAALVSLTAKASLGAPSSIGPTGLLNVPTAEVVPSSTTEAMVAYDRSRIADERIEVYPIVNLEYGFKKGEVGVSYFGIKDLTDVKAFNAKYLFTPGSAKSPAIAAGVIYLKGDTAETDFYVVATQRLGAKDNIRATGGVLYQKPSNVSGSNTTGMFGLEFGKPGKTTIGFDYVVKDIAAGKLYGAILRQPITKDLTGQIGIGNHSRFFAGLTLRFGGK